MTRTVLLRHDLPDGSSHLDWLIERPGCTDEHRLIAFRLTEPPDCSASSEFLGTRLPDHRAHYLEYEGTISGDRGRVTRVAAGQARIERDEAELLTMWVDFGDGGHDYRAAPAAGSDEWCFSRGPIG